MKIKVLNLLELKVKVQSSHGNISLYFWYLTRNSPIFLVFCVCSIVAKSNSVVSLRDLLQNIPELHWKMCSKLSWSCLQKRQFKSLSYFLLKLYLMSQTPTLALKTMRETSGLNFERYGALINLLYDKRHVFLLVEHISISERNATCLIRSFTILFHVSYVIIQTFSSFRGRLYLLILTFHGISF